MDKYIDADALIEDITAAEENGGMGAVVASTLKRYVARMPAADVEPVRGWIPCSERLPDNARKPNAICPKYLIYTNYGITEGWYRADEKGWYALIWFMDGRYEEWNVDFKRGDVPKTIFIPDGGKVKVYAWRDFPEPPKIDGGSEDGQTKIDKK